jgi:hypothetical protein
MDVSEGELMQLVMGTKNTLTNKAPNNERSRIMISWRFRLLG